MFIAIQSRRNRVQVDFLVDIHIYIYRYIAQLQDAQVFDFQMIWGEMRLAKRLQVCWLWDLPAFQTLMAYESVRVKATMMT